MDAARSEPRFVTPREIDRRADRRCPLYRERGRIRQYDRVLRDDRIAGAECALETKRRDDAALEYGVLHVQIVKRGVLADLQVRNAAVGAAERMRVATGDGEGIGGQQVAPERRRPEGKRAAAFRPVRQYERGLAGDGFH